MGASPKPQKEPDVSEVLKRRTERIMLEIPIRVISFGGEAGSFTEDTRTVIVNRDGGLIALNHRLAPDESIRIINLENHREADFRVVGLARHEEGATNHWGVECLDKDRCLWDIDFPRPMENKDTRAGALLKCAGCGKESLSVLTLTEINMLDTSGAIEKLCERCCELTSWGYSEERGTRRDQPSAPTKQVVEPASPSSQGVEIEFGDPAPPVEPSQASGQNPLSNSRVEIPESAPAPAVLTPSAPETLETSSAHAPKWDGKYERRLYKRLTLKLPVLIRNYRGETEIGRTENISKGGIGVGLEMVLALGERVAVICPYSGSGSEIEQTADVRRRISLYGGKKWFYGLRYIL